VTGRESEERGGHGGLPRLGRYTESLLDDSPILTRFENHSTRVFWGSERGEKALWRRTRAKGGSTIWKST